MSRPLDKALIGVVEELLRFRYATICRHAAAASILSAFEEAGYVVTKELAAAVVDADDETALELLHTVKL